MDNNEKSWIDFPVVTGLMVFTNPQQFTAARASVDCFFAQSWPHKELVVFNSTKLKLSRWWRKTNPTELHLKYTNYAKAIEICRDNSSGEWCFNWFPDCWYEASYVSKFMEFKNKRQLTMLKNVDVFSLKDQSRATISGSVIECWSIYRHFSVDFNTPIKNQFPNVVEIDNSPGLIIKFASEVI